MFFSFVANELCFKNALEIQEYIPSLPHILITSKVPSHVTRFYISPFHLLSFFTNTCMQYMIVLCIHRVSQKKLYFTFLLISQLILIVEKRVGYPQKWHGKRLPTICDSTPLPGSREIGILGEILTLIERTPLHSALDSTFSNTR